MQWDYVIPAVPYPPQIAETPKVPSVSGVARRKY